MYFTKHIWNTLVNLDLSLTSFDFSTKSYVCKQINFAIFRIKKVCPGSMTIAAYKVYQRPKNAIFSHLPPKYQSWSIILYSWSRRNPISSERSELIRAHYEDQCERFDLLRTCCIRIVTKLHPNYRVRDQGPRNQWVYLPVAIGRSNLPASLELIKPAFGEP